MTPTDLLFLYTCACALSWGAHWMKVWERADRERQWNDPLSHVTVGWLMEVNATISADRRRIKVMGYEIGETVFDLLNARKRAGPDNWIPSRFCSNEYKINEAVNLALIDKLWPKHPNHESNPTDRI